MQINKIAGLLPVLCLVSSAAMAEGVYLGAKVGVMSPDVSELDDATNVGAVIGYEFGELADSVTWALEGEFTTTASDGDVKIAGVSGDWDVDTQALYAVLRVGSNIYGKLRLGYLREDITISVKGFSASEDDTGVSGGLGAGWRINEAFAVEAEYTFIEDDLDFYSLGVNYSF